MKVFISADIEGVTGVVNWAQCGGPNDGLHDWNFARRMMTADVNAAVVGAFEGGATQVVVKDSHGRSKNLLIDELDPRVELITGFGAGVDGMMEGIDESFVAAILVGYHGMAGALNGVMEHTITGSLHRYTINGAPSGEIAMSAATAGQYGVPLVAISSDYVGCEEAVALIPGVHTAVVKYGLGRYMARVLHPTRTQPLIRETVARAVWNRHQIIPYRLEGQVVVTIEQNRSEETDALAQLPGWTRVNAHTVSYEAPDWPTAHRASRAAMAFATVGRQSGD